MSESVRKNFCLIRRISLTKVFEWHKAGCIVEISLGDIGWREMRKPTKSRRARRVVAGGGEQKMENGS